MIAPKAESRELVLQWLASEDFDGPVSISQRSDSIVLEASVSQIEKLLKAEYSTFGQSTNFSGIWRRLCPDLAEAIP